MTRTEKERSLDAILERLRQKKPDVSHFIHEWYESEKEEPPGPKPATMVKGQLFVDTVPMDATVVIPDLNETFVQGMKLTPGTYHLEVSANGYKPFGSQFLLASGEVKRVLIRLEEIQPKPQPLISRQEQVFWLLWVLTISIGWFISWCLNHYFIVPLTDSAVLVGITQGIFIGVPQYIVLSHQNIRIPPWLLAVWWIGATTAGIIVNCRYDVAYDDSKIYNWGLWGAVLGTFQVFVLYFFLKIKFPWAAFWIVLSALGTALGSLWLGPSPLWPFTNTFVGTTYGALTGFGLIWLLRQRYSGS
ncbi:PEGA domain-containing protein [Desulfobacca acetoxidans]